jgi:hypothetical protein
MLLSISYYSFFFFFYRNILSDNLLFKVLFILIFLSFDFWSSKSCEDSSGSSVFSSVIVKLSGIKSPSPSKFNPIAS